MTMPAQNWKSERLPFLKSFIDALNLTKGEGYHVVWQSCYPRYNEFHYGDNNFHLCLQCGVYRNQRVFFENNAATISIYSTRKEKAIGLWIQIALSAIKNAGGIKKGELFFPTRGGTGQLYYASFSDLNTSVSQTEEWDEIREDWKQIIDVFSAAKTALLENTLQTLINTQPEMVKAYLNHEDVSELIAKYIGNGNCVIS